MNDKKETIAIIGGSGALGSGLSNCFAHAGYNVIIGSRTAEKAHIAVNRILSTDDQLSVHGMTNQNAAMNGKIVFITVPFLHQPTILEEIKKHVLNKIVIDTTVPLVPPKVGTVQLPSIGSAALQAEKILGPEVTLLSAFHNIAADKLGRKDFWDCDVLVFGNQIEARKLVIDLAKAIGIRGIHGGPLANSAAAEAMTSVLISINKRYKVQGAGIKITGTLLNETHTNAPR